MRITCSRLIVACVFLGASLLTVANAQPKYGVTVQAVNPAGLAKAKTYLWAPNTPTFDKQADTLIIAAVDRELAARGYSKVPSGKSDALVSYEALGRTDLDLKSKTKDGSPREFSVGMLIVNLRDAATSQSLFRVRMDTPIERNPATIEATINAAVTAMFEKYPPAKR